MEKDRLKNMKGIEKPYRYIFWVGYILVFAEAFVTLKVDLHKIIIGGASIKFHLDQILHAVVYFFICLYFLAGQQFGLTLFKVDSFQKFLVAVIILTTATEVVQLGVPSRAFNVFDWLSNIIGICIGVGVILGTRRTGIRD